MKNFKKILMLLAVFVLAFSLFLTACSEECTEHKDDDKNGKCDVCAADVETEAVCTDHKDENGDGMCDDCSETVSDGKVKYTVTVKDESGNAIPGIVLQIGERPEKESEVTTDASGKAEYSIKPTGRRVFVEFVNVTDDYEEPVDDVEFENGKYEITVTLKKLESYTVSVVDQDGVALSDITVKLCQGETCLTPKKTDENGNAVFKFAPNGAQLKAMVEDAPEQYSFKTDYDYFETGAKSIVLTVYEKVEVTVTVKDESGAAIVGATVALYVDNSEIETFTTDAEGKFVFLSPVTDSNTVKLWFKTAPAGYSDPESKIVTLDSDTVTVEFVCSAN